MSYGYYQSSVPQWGTSEFQFTRPPTPRFRPEPHWTGYDYYRAHALNDDPLLYQSVMGRLSVAVGVGFHEARHWHRRIYSGQVNLAQVLPFEIGSAAAYEAYRFWKYHHPLCEPLGNDLGRQREAIIGMAIAEATHLWRYTGRPIDNIGLQTACEAAAATASHIANKVLGIDATIPTSGAPLGYQYQSPSIYPPYDGYSRRPRTLRRYSSVGSNMSTLTGSTYLGSQTRYITSPYGSATPIANTSPYVATAVPAASSPYVTSSVGSMGSPAMGIQGVYSGSVPQGTSTVPTAYPLGMMPTTSGVPFAYPTATVVSSTYPVASTAYPAGTIVSSQPVPTYGGARYGTTIAPGYSVYPGQPGTLPPGSTIIIRRPRHHHHNHRSRSYSTERY